MRDEHGPVRVAVEGDAQVRARGQHLGAKIVQVLGAAAQVDILPVGRAVDAVQLRSQTLQQRGREMRGRTVGCVHHDVHSFEPGGERGGQMIDVGAVEAFVYCERRRRGRDFAFEPCKNMLFEQMLLFIRKL